MHTKGSVIHDWWSGRKGADRAVFVRQFTTGKRFDMTAAFAARNHGQVSEATKKTQAKVEKMELDELKPLIKPERGGDDDDLFGDGGGKQEMVSDFGTCMCFCSRA